MPKPPKHKLALVSQKGGTGKTTSAVEMAQACVELGLSVLIVDADKGDSALRWSDLAGAQGGLSFPVVGMAVTDLHRKVPGVDDGREVVILDVPQVEDHRRVARGALLYADTWCVPVAPAGIEVDRMLADGALADLMEEVQDARTDAGQARAMVVCFFNRTNTAQPTMTGPDADVREALTDHGWTVAKTHIPHGDERYRQPFGCPIDADEHYLSLVNELFGMGA